MLRWNRFSSWFHVRISSLGENLLPQLTCSATLDGIQMGVYPANLDMSGVPPALCWLPTYSSAPSMVTSSLVYWSMSPSVSPALTMSSFDWKPAGGHRKKDEECRV